MPIPIKCPGCGKALRVKDEFAGKRGNCPSCGAVLVVPAQTAPEAAPASERSPWLLVGGLIGIGCVVLAGWTVFLFRAKQPYAPEPSLVGVPEEEQIALGRPAPEEPARAAAVARDRGGMEGTGTRAAPVEVARARRVEGKVGTPEHAAAVVAHVPPRGFKAPGRKGTGLPKITAGQGVTVGEVRQGPGKQWIGHSTVGGEQGDIYVDKKPAKPEYGRWLLVQVDMTFPWPRPGGWQLSASQCHLRSTTDPDEEPPCLAIIRPNVFRRENPQVGDLLPRTLCHGETRYSTYLIPALGPSPFNPDSRPTEVLENMYETIGIDSVSPGDKLSFALAFPEELADSGGEYTLVIPLEGKSTIERHRAPEIWELPEGF